MRALWTGRRRPKKAAKKRNKAGRLGDFVKALKQSLDNAYKPHWHVMAGNSLGFACKNRQRTVGVWHITPVAKDGKELKVGWRLMVVIWKSPGLEPLSPGLLDRERNVDSAEEATEGTAASSTVDESKSASRENATPGASSLHIVQPPAAEVGEGSEVESAIAVLRDVASKNAALEAVELSKLLRRRLTKELGVIWHVAVGREFVIEPATCCRNYVLATLGKDLHVVCFQHEQMEGDKIQWRKIISGLPWLLVVFVCFGYMAFQNLCEKKDATGQPLRGRTGLNGWFERRVCMKEDWEMEFGIMAIVSVATSFVAKRLFKDT